MPNQLSSGVTKEMVEAAVAASGFPLQTRVAKTMRSAFPLQTDWLFHVQEEWSYIDEESDILRALDLRVESDLYPLSEVNDRPVRPGVSILIECKQSELPFVFFATESWSGLPMFPLYGGLRRQNIHVITDDDLSTWNLRVPEALGLREDPFVRSAPRYGTSLIRCSWKKGGALELSGPDAYQGIVLPLLKAARYLKRSMRTKGQPFYHDLHAIIPLAVIDGPMMIATEASADQQELEFVPWVRLIRHEPQRSARFPHPVDLVLALDVVSYDFLAEYVQKHLVPFAMTFGDRAKKHAEVLSSGQGYIEGMGADSWQNIEDRLQMRTTLNELRRNTAIGVRRLRYYISRAMRLDS
jgi:hypothetical protein